MARSRLKFLRYSKKHSDFICRCPECGETGLLMSHFSWLEAGFNGIKRGDPDDVDLQECGKCAARLEWDMPDESDLDYQPSAMLARALEYLWSNEQKDFIVARASRRKRHIFRDFFRLHLWRKRAGSREGY